MSVLSKFRAKIVRGALRLVEAIANQRRALVEAEGEGTETEEQLDVLLRWANKLNPAKADKEADKVLRAAGLNL